MKWEWCNIKGDINKKQEQTNYQIDEVGNICQRTGGVKAKVCQKCKVEFKTKKKFNEVKKQLPAYQCKECDFTNTSPEFAFDHKLETEHTITKTTKEFVTKIETLLVGNRPNIIKTDKNITILCDKCLK